MVSLPAGQRGRPFFFCREKALVSCGHLRYFIGGDRVEPLSFRDGGMYSPVVTVFYVCFAFSGTRGTNAYISCQGLTFLPGCRTFFVRSNRTLFINICNYISYEALLGWRARLDLFLGIEK